jgi:MFS family permease
MTVALTGYQLLGETTPIWVLCVLFFIQGIGMGAIMPPATEAVMSVVPRERAGAGSALTNTARQVSGALGVAVLGSILAQVYRSQLSPHLGNLPASARDAAAGSITASQAVAAKLGAAGQGLASAANSSFIHAMHVTTLISAGITLLGAIIVLRWMPGRAPAAPATQAPAADQAAVAQAAVAQATVPQPAVTQAALEPVAAELATADHAVAAQLASAGDAAGSAGPVAVEG